jgi:hypothetical protein
MIKGLMGGPGVVVDGGNTSLPYVSQNSSDSFSGLIRIHGSELQYYQNGAWTNLPTSYATVKIDAGTESVLNWARAKQMEEADQLSKRYSRERRAKQHPSLAIAWNAVIEAESNRDTEVKKAMENFDLLDKLVGEESGAGLVMPMGPSP